MADAATAEAKVVAPSRGISLKIVVIISLATLLLGLGGAFFFFKLQHGSSAANEHEAPATAAPQKDTHNDPAAKPASAGKAAPGPIFDLDAFIVNLMDAPESRYLKLTAKLELERSEVSAELTPRLPQVRDTILILLSSKDAATMRSPEGKFQLRDEMIQRLNSLLPRGGIRSVYFTEFVVQ
ncbi:MAG: flagellar basal body-associated FliL family protein [Nitrospiraceae bacterium]